MNRAEVDFVTNAINEYAGTGSYLTSTNGLGVFLLGMASAISDMDSNDRQQVLRRIDATLERYMSVARSIGDSNEAQLNAIVGLLNAQLKKDIETFVEMRCAALTG